MEKDQYIQQLHEAFRANKLEHLLTNDTCEKLFAFSNDLVECNKQFNLTAITDEREIIIKHFIDCASISPLIASNSTVIDVGCGAGFPSIPLAIFRSDITIIALDSTQKRINFVNEQAARLGLCNLNGVCARAEEHCTQNRESFDYCVSRAVARLNVLSELCIPLIKIDGQFIAMKSIKGDEEYAEAKNAISKLGCTLDSKQTDAFEYSGISTQRTLLTFKKIRKTPSEFPRKYSQILKKPL